ncbi:MAG: hypothetical protein ABIJ09_16310 [Pseudomonadota bacterium]
MSSRRTQLGLLLLLAACPASPVDQDQLLFECQIDGDCSQGYRCHGKPGRCVAVALLADAGALDSRRVPVDAHQDRHLVDQGGAQDSAILDLETPEGGPPDLWVADLASANDLSPMDAGGDASADAEAADALAPDVTPDDGAFRDAGVDLDALPGDLQSAVDATSADTSNAESGSPDLGSDAADGASVDSALPGDASLPDLAQPDQALPDLYTPECVEPSRQCQGNLNQICSSEHWINIEYCPLGCASGEIRCQRPALSGGIDPEWVRLATAALAPDADLVLDTDLGTLAGAPWPDFHVGNMADCAGQPVEVGVFAFTNMAVPVGVRVRVRGTRAAALVARGDALIEGVIDVSGGRAACAASAATCAGPGGFAGGLAENPGQQGSGPGGGGGGMGFYSSSGGDEMGGGGGGHAAVGGRGGNDPGTPATLGGSGGLLVGTTALCGGSGGGGGGLGSNATANPAYGGAGGGGGGAIVLASWTRVTVRGAGAGIHGSGGGGEGDRFSSYDDGGGGGGAGGRLVVEAPAVEISGGAILAANGGAGGGAGSYPVQDGEDGPFAAREAVAGAGGGNGGWRDRSSGLDGVDSQDGSGGGGGSAGVVVLRAARLSDVDVGSGVLSPVPSVEVLQGL